MFWFPSPPFPLVPLTSKLKTVLKEFNDEMHIAVVRTCSSDITRSEYRPNRKRVRGIFRYASRCLYLCLECGRDQL